VDEILKSRGATADTIVAWQCACKVKYFNAFELALQATPFIEMLAKLLLREYGYIEKFASPPPPVTQQVSEMQVQGQQEAKQETPADN
jgi:hypothetical protein